jgi:hypothetical protein
VRVLRMVLGLRFSTLLAAVGGPVSSRRYVAVGSFARLAFTVLGHFAFARAVAAARRNLHKRKAGHSHSHSQKLGTQYS